MASKRHEAAAHKDGPPSLFNPSDRVEDTRTPAPGSPEGDRSVPCCERDTDYDGECPWHPRRNPQDDR